MNWQQRVAKQFTADLIQTQLKLLESGDSDLSDLAAVVHLMPLSNKDLKKLTSALKAIAKRFEQSADLPERMIHWREALEQ